MTLRLNYRSCSITAFQPIQILNGQPGQVGYGAGNSGFVKLIASA